MGRNYYKATYNSIGDYGSTEKITIYGVFNRSGDVLSIYDSDGELILSDMDWDGDTLIDAINKINKGESEELSSEERIFLKNL